MPGLPLTPTLSIFFNLYLMFLMDLDTWIRFAIWLAAGNLIFLDIIANNQNLTNIHFIDIDSGL